MSTFPRLNSVLRPLSSLALADLEDLWMLPPAELEVALRDLLPGLVDTWAEVGASVGAEWYDELRDTQTVSGQFQAIVAPLGNLGADELAGWASEPLRLVEPDVASARARLQAGFQKRLVNSANLSVTGSAQADPQAVGYQRRTSPGACKFCIMVASRPAIYTEASSTFACHDWCFCESVPAWGGRGRPVDPYKPSDRPMNDTDRARVRKWIADNLN